MIDIHCPHCWEWVTWDEISRSNYYDFECPKCEHEIIVETEDNGYIAYEAE